MSDQQQAPAISAGAPQDALSGQVNLFLFDLKNEALEHGFKADESWAVELASEAEMISLRKEHYPVVSIRLQPNLLLDVFRQVKYRLHQSLNKTDAELTESVLVQDEKKHLAAYPARTVRK